MKFKHLEYFEVVSRDDNVDLDSIAAAFADKSGYVSSRTRLNTGLELLRIAQKDSEFLIKNQ